MSACSGGGGVHAKQDRFSGLQEEMDQQHTSSLQDPPDIIDMLNFPLASTGERFGAVRRFQPFIDETLESARLHAVAQPSVTLSAWIYLLSGCHTSYVGSSIMWIGTRSVITQARVTSGEDEAFRARVVLPLWKWIRLVCYIQDSKLMHYYSMSDFHVPLDAAWDDKTHRYVYEFRHSIHYDDTDGYFGIEGRKYMPAMNGNFGPIKYYRFGTKEMTNKLHHKSTLQELDRAHRECQKITAFTKAFLTEATESHLPSPIKKRCCACTSHSLRLWGQIEEKITHAHKHGLGKHNLNTVHFIIPCKPKRRKLEQVRIFEQERLRTLFKESVGTMFPAAQIKITSKSTSLLQVSQSNHKACLLMASILLSNLGHSTTSRVTHVYSLIGALGDDCLHAEYKHTQGIDWFPKNLDMAYGYYVNAGAQTSTDTCRIHDKKQYTPEHIYLSNPEDLNALTDETSDIFQYLKLQAERGDLQSQTRGFQLLKKAADIVHVYKAAFQLFLSASRFGHVTASVEAAWYLPTGSLEGLSQDVERAVILLKKVFERNRHLGFMIREALRAYLKGSCDSQGIYNLVVLGQQGHALSLSIHGLFNVSRHEGMDVVVEKILKRCVETENEKAVTPCSLALLGVQMGKALRRMTQNSAQLLLTYASLLSACVFIVVMPLLKQKAPSSRGHPHQARTSSVSQDGARLNRGQRGIVGGTYTVAGNLWLIILNGEHWLRQNSDLAVTLSGMCLCAFWATLLYHPL
ncbi:hypothetical protein Q8A73_008628 [Channa argus]|nr:hypothetical protein Q8A73_008628 [Channa argus]